MVEKLTKNVNEGHLRELFEPFGKIVDMDLPMNRQCKLFLPPLLVNLLRF